MALYAPYQKVGDLRTDNSAQAERTLITCLSDAAYELQSKYFLISSVDTDYYVWLNIDGGGSDPLVSAHTAVPVALNEREKSTVQCVADSSSSLNNKYFTLNSPSTGYYVWFNVAAAGVDPAPGGRTGIPVAIAANASAATVASAVQVAVDALADFVATVVTDTVTITNAAKGNVTDAANVNAGVVVTILRQGGDGLAATIASAIATQLDALSGIVASASSGVVTASSSVTGNSPDASAGNSGFTVVNNVEGYDALMGPATLNSTLSPNPVIVIPVT